MPRFLMTLCALIAVAACWASPARADEALRAAIREELAKVKAGDDAKTLSVRWDHGLKFEGTSWKGQIGGRIQLDTVFVSDKDFAAASGQSRRHSYVRFRRVRLFTAGRVGKHVGYKVQVDFAGNSVHLDDVYVDVVGLRDCFGCGAPNFRIGHAKEPFSLEALTSSKYIPFMERAPVTNVIAPGRSSGIRISDVWRGGQLGYAAGIYPNSPVEFNNPHAGSGDADLDRDGWGATGRVWWAPWYDCTCKCRRLHVGVSASYLGDMRESRWRARPNLVSIGDRVVDTGVLPTDSAFLYGAELAWVQGPWSVQAEAMGSSLSAPAAGDPAFWGWYAQASYWLTGECSNWKDGVFHRVSPCCDWLDRDCCCKGAWQLAVRYSWLDLDDGLVQGGKLGLWEVALNWHLNAMSRIMFDVALARPEVLDGAGALVDDETLLSFGMRFQVEF
jgi:phosphate-selective porin OprO/OprP